VEIETEWARAVEMWRCCLTRFLNYEQLTLAGAKTEITPHEHLPPSLPSLSMAARGWQELMAVSPPTGQNLN